MNKQDTQPKKKRPLQFLTLVILCLLSLTSCEEESVNQLVLSRDQVSLPSEGGEVTILLQTDADEWRIQNPMDWVVISPTSGNSESTEIVITVSTKTPEERSGELTVIAGSADPVKIGVTQEPSEYLYSLSANFVELSFKKGGSTNTISVTTDAPEWQISSDASWIHFDKESGSAGVTDVSITADENRSGLEREAVISITGEYVPAEEIPATQIGEYYPDYNTSPQDPDPSGMESTAVELAAKMTLGINIGNTLEAIGGETAWGNPQINETFVGTLKEKGFSAVRLPCSFDQYADTKAKISDTWLNRVKTVVQYCFDNDLYVILNIHWDGGWLENNVSSAKQEEVNAKQKAYWQQIATHLRDYDERLIFASANEPHAENASQMSVLMSYHQTFIDAVRSTGGRNSYRILIFQGPSTDIEKTEDLLVQYPTDEVEDRLMAELHYYTPYQFTLMEQDADWGNVFYYWGSDYHSEVEPERNATWGEEADMERLFGAASTQLVNRGYPIVLGEFGAYKRSGVAEPELHAASVDYFNQYVVKTALDNGMIPFYWDTGGMINRSNGDVKDESLLQALLSGAE
ncbi:cellulase family glycosylhydrolase [Marinoscillum sp.]|uniref:cellulase family glycosylhydrolase n=1 Tax=Marinoscillum sp. TaxID=2024838 RepID=UPI003BAD455B